MDKRKKVVLITIVSGFTIIGGCFIYNNHKVQKTKDKILNDLNTSNIELTFEESPKEIIDLNIKTGDEKLSVLFEDYYIDGDYIFFGISEIQNIKASDFKVNSKEEYKKYIEKIRKQYELEKENYTNIGNSIIQSQIAIFNGEQPNVNQFSLSSEDLAILNREIEYINACYNWGISDEDFLKEFKTSSGDTMKLMDNIAVPYINISINGEKQNLELISTPVQLNSKYFKKLGFSTEIENENYHLMEYTLGVKIPENAKEFDAINIDIEFDGYGLSAYYPVTIGDNLKTSFTLKNNDFSSANKIIEINKNLDLDNETITVLDYKEYDSFCEIRYKTSLDTYNYNFDISIENKNPIEPLFVSIDNEDSSILSYKYKKFNDNINLTFERDTDFEVSIPLEIK